VGLTKHLIGPYCLPGLQEIVISVATAKMMVLNDKIQTLTLPWHGYLLNLSIDIGGLNLLSYFLFKLVIKKH
jgi:hypothetical protein